MCLTPCTVQPDTFPCLCPSTQPCGQAGLGCLPQVMLCIKQQQKPSRTHILLSQQHEHNSGVISSMRGQFFSSATSSQWYQATVWGLSMTPIETGSKGLVMLVGTMRHYCGNFSVWQETNGTHAIS